jgi:hypothetical protein
MVVEHVDVIEDERGRVVAVRMTVSRCRATHMQLYRFRDCRPSEKEAYYYQNVLEISLKYVDSNDIVGDDDLDPTCNLAVSRSGAKQ